MVIHRSLHQGRVRFCYVTNVRLQSRNWLWKRGGEWLFQHRFKLWFLSSFLSVCEVSDILRTPRLWLNSGYFLCLAEFHPFHYFARYACRYWNKTFNVFSLSLFFFFFFLFHPDFLRFVLIATDNGFIWRRRKIARKYGGWSVWVYWSFSLNFRHMRWFISSSSNIDLLRFVHKREKIYNNTSNLFSMHWRFKQTTFFLFFFFGGGIKVLANYIVIWFLFFNLLFLFKYFM